MKFKKFKTMAKAAVTFKNKLEEDFEAFKEAEDKNLEQNIREAKKHYKTIAQNLQEMNENGSYPEMTNMILSIQRSKQAA